MGSKSAIDLVRSIRNYLEEPLSEGELLVSTAGSGWKNSNILEQINDAKDEAQFLIRKANEDYFLVVGNTSVSLTVSDRSYTLPSDFLTLKNIRVTTTGYERTKFTPKDSSSPEFVHNYSIPQSEGGSTFHFYFDIVADRTLLISNFPAVAMATEIDYIKFLTDYTLATDSTLDIKDVLLRYIKLDATCRCLAQKGKEYNDKFQKFQALKMEARASLIDEVSPRQIKESERITPYAP